MDDMQRLRRGNVTSEKAIQPSTRQHKPQTRFEHPLDNSINEFLQPNYTNESVLEYYKNILSMPSLILYPIGENNFEKILI